MKTPNRGSDIDFCNGEARCGCVLDFVSGNGEYSDGGSVWLCKKHQSDFTKEQIKKEAERRKKVFKKTQKMFPEIELLDEDGNFTKVVVNGRNERPLLHSRGKELK